MRTPWIALALPLAVFWGTGIPAQEPAAHKSQFVVTADTPQLENRLKALITAIALVEVPRTPETELRLVGQPPLERDVLISYITRPGALTGTGFAPEVLDALPEATRETWGAVETSSDSCDIREIVFGDALRHIVGVHNSTGAEAEDPQRCLMALMWFAQTRDLSKIDPNLWRANYARIMVNLASGARVVAARPDAPDQQPAKQ